MFAVLLNSVSQSQDIVTGEAATAGDGGRRCTPYRADGDHGRFTLGQRPGLIEGNGLDLAKRFDIYPALE